MTNKVEICLHLNLGTKYGFVRTETWYGVKLKYCQDHTCCRMNKGVFTDDRRQISSVPNDHPVTPQLSDSPSSTQICDSPRSTSSPSAENQFQRRQMEPAEKLTGDAEHEPITTRSGREVRKPQRLIYSCWRGDVVIF